MIVNKALSPRSQRFVLRGLDPSGGSRCCQAAWARIAAKASPPNANKQVSSAGISILLRRIGAATNHTGDFSAIKVRLISPIFNSSPELSL